MIFLMIFALTFCSAVTAHPGHDTHYPEEVTNVNSTANATPSAGSESSPWSTAIIAGLVTTCLAGAGFLFKRGRG